MNKVVFRTSKEAEPSPEMIEWLFEHGYKENDNIEYHNPLLVQCVEELMPPDWGVQYIDGDEYTVIQTLNDEVILSRNDIENFKWRKIR